MSQSIYFFSLYPIPHKSFQNFCFYSLCEVVMCILGSKKCHYKPYKNYAILKQYKEVVGD